MDVAFVPVTVAMEPQTKTPMVCVTHNEAEKNKKEKKKA